MLTGGEEFEIATQPGLDLLLVTRVHGRNSVPLRVSLENGWETGRVQPAVPGRWLEVASLIPGEQITGRKTRIRIEADVRDPAVEAYMPYYHWAYQGTFSPSMDERNPVACFGTDNEIKLLDHQVEWRVDQIEVRLTWMGPAPDTGDGVVFVHLYNQDNVNTEPIAQTIARPAGDVLPPGNWLPGRIDDVFQLHLPDELPPGTYVIAVGLFDARTGQRFPATGDGADDGRLFIGEIELEETVQ
jgi:hypothetical protein